MNIITKLTLRHLIQNKKRTVVTILGIAISTALITAMMLGVYSFFCFYSGISMKIEGNWAFFAKDLSEEQNQSLKNDPRVSLVGIRDYNLEKTGFMLDTDTKPRFRTGNIYHADHNNLIQMVTCDYDGKLPENAGEIAVEEELLRENGLDMKPGDTLSFTQGYRYKYELDEMVYLGGGYQSNELFEEKSEETCVITAILHGNQVTRDYKILRGTDAEEKSTDPITFVTLEKCDYTADFQIEDMIREYGLTKVEKNSEYLLSVFAISMNSHSAIAALFRLMGVALLVVVGVSVILIYNAFAMSLSEKVRYLGMLASVGATRQQKRFGIYMEGLLLGLVGIPLGFGLGAAGSGITLHVLGSKILAADMLTGMSGMRGGIPLHVSPLIILIIVVIAGITIFISSVIPAVKASRIMPVEAIRSSHDSRLRAWKLKTFPGIHSLFGVEGKMAYKNFKRNGGKGILITLSIVVSVVMLVNIMYFCDLFRKVNSYEIDLPFEIYATASYEDKDRLKEDLKSVTGVNDVYASDMVVFDFEAKDENGNPKERPNSSFLNPEYLSKGYEELFNKVHAVNVVLMDDAEFVELSKKMYGDGTGLAEGTMSGSESTTGNSLDESMQKESTSDGALAEGTLSDNAVPGIILNNYAHKATRKKVFNDNIVGAKLYYDNPKNNPPAVEIVGLADWDKNNKYFNICPKNSISVLVPADVYYELASENNDPAELIYTYAVEAPNHEEVTERIREMLENDGYQSYSCYDVARELQVMMTVLTLLKTVMYGFTILLSLIAATNIANTISTGVLMRRKEFAMFRSVGMTNGSVKKMLFLETFFYGFFALIIAVPVSVVISLIMYYSLGSMVTVPFEVNVLTYIFVSLGVFALIGLSMLMSTSTIKNDSIIEGLREDMS
ncbi:MAG: ABC transporter permease [Lachnospiraceae bacterium]|nr:ABC transporter permease [Lachnospiraceae bacterium]